MPASRGDIHALVMEMGEHLEHQPTLADLSRRSAMSPFHFHRAFTAVVGETPKQHVLRVRLERAAYLIAISDASILRIALDVGFRSHETFTRAFRQRFDDSPAGYRKAARIAQSARLHSNAAFAGAGCQLSAVGPFLLPPTRLLCARYTGPYAQMPVPPFHEADQRWRPLADWARAKRMAHERTAWVMCLDDPTVTDGPQQRLDAGIPVMSAASSHERFAVREFMGGWYAGVEHVGPHDSIIQAYRHAADWVRRSESHTFGTGPPVQIFRYLDADPQRHRTEVFLPIRRR
ncbi:MAG: AraC family transcriptional regulator [Gemmatimonadota bacterium]